MRSTLKTMNAKEYQPHVGLQKVIPRDGEIDRSTVDIIAIHGLDTDSPRTWTHKRGESEINWLESLLPAAVEYARIYTYNWNARVFNNAPVETIFGQADRFLTLVDARHGASSRSILFIASCFGGLVLAEAIIRAAREGSQYRQVLQYTVGIVFLATPFFGTDAAREASWLVVVKGIMGKDPSNELIKDLERNHDKIRNRVNDFVLIANTDSTKIPIWFFYETLKTKIMKKIFGAWIPHKLLRGSILVEKNSACIPGFEHSGLKRTHVMMNKFENDKCTDYALVRYAIVTMLEQGKVIKEQRDQLFASLKFTGMNERKNDSYDGTFPWIFHTSDSPLEDDRASSDSDTHHTPPEASEDNFDNSKDRPWSDFEDWLRSEHTTYWISGKFGSGKTTLMKYIIAHPQTMKDLSVWAKDPVIISHFFWKAGHLKLQKDLKGCLFSIIHQALESDRGSLRRILATGNSLSTKTSDTDWSLKELQGLCLDVLSNRQAPVCIFLDGLDEICREDRAGLLELVHKLRAIPNTKLCLASRPEPHFKSAFSTYPQLRLQDLTLWDMKNYASETLQPHISKDRISSSVGSHITDTLIRKADGVFLWLRLALLDLCNGLLQYRDSDSELYARLDQMPDELNDLYEDIWTRINKDSPIYRKHAALYFKIVIDSMRGRLEARGTLLHLVATTTDLVQRSFISSTDTTSLKKECEATIQKIEQRCIGLLEIVPSSYSASAKTRNPQDAFLQPYWQMKVQFSHRTAYDFFTDSNQGKRILEFDSSTPHDLSLRLLKSDIVTIKLIQWLSGVDQPLDTLSPLTDSIPRENINEVLNSLWHLYDNGYYYHDGVRKPHFLAVAARLPFREFVLSNIESSPNPSLLATHVLRYKSNPYHRFIRPSNFKNMLDDFWDPLLKLEADPSRKGICYPQEFSFETGPIMPFRSPTSHFLLSIFQDHFSNIDEDRRQLQRFIQAKANLQERIPFLIEEAKNELYIGYGFGNRRFYSSGPETALVVLDLELEFLVRVYFERTRKREMTSSTDAIPYRPPGDNSSDTSIRIVLIGFKNYRHSETPYYQCSSNAATKQLLQLLAQSLYGDKSTELAKAVHHELDKIKNDIRDGSSEYPEVELEDLEAYLAERGLGYCFGDKVDVDALD